MLCAPLHFWNTATYRVPGWAEIVLALRHTFLFCVAALAADYWSLSSPIRFHFVAVVNKRESWHWFPLHCSICQHLCGIGKCLPNRWSLAKVLLMGDGIYFVNKWVESASEWRTQQCTYVDWRVLQKELLCQRVWWMQILLAVIPFSDITKVDPIRDSCRRDGSRSLFMMMGLYSACAG